MLKRHQKNLRKNLTPAERIFWYQARNKLFYGLKFRRQHIIGKYIVDFYCPRYKVIVEIDGDTHAGKMASKLDQLRSKYLESVGNRAIRYNNRDVLNNIDGVMEDLKSKIFIH